MPDDSNSQSAEDRKKKSAKDLSHVPCKFFKVGSCTAGAGCPFSHTALEPGQQKDVCAWFVKGTCKFGHKCALAHILPGQPMSMDRKNKKAAQAALGKEQKEINGNNKKEVKLRKDRPERKDSTAGRPPITMQLKASISAPAPALADADFAETKLPNAPALDPAPSQINPLQPDPPSSSPRPIDFGPIGSPPKHIPLAQNSQVVDDLESFLPSSLTDLLTPEEISRRMASTSPHNHSSMNNHTQHRYSRSVPAPSLLASTPGTGNSIWSTSPSQRARFDPLGGENPSGSLDHIDAFLNPTNASAAFLPSLLSRGSMLPQTRTNGGGSGSLTPLGAVGGGGSSNVPLSLSSLSLAASRGASSSTTLSRSPPSHSLLSQSHSQSLLNGFGNHINHNHHHHHSSSTQLHNTTGGLGGGAVGAEHPTGLTAGLTALSPQTLQTLKSHLPGQSLPQTLPAAGYSRIHALPPMPLSSSTIGSLGAAGSLGAVGSPPLSSSPMRSGGLTHPSDWGSSPLPPQRGVVGAPSSFGTQSSFAGAFPPMAAPAQTIAAKLSYSAALAASSRPPGLPAAISRSSSSTGGTGTGNSTPNTKWGAVGAGVTSPLGGHAAGAGDDDDLFGIEIGH